MNVELEFPGVVGSVAKLLDAARSALSVDPQAAGRYICEAAVLLKVDTLTPDAVPSKSPGALPRWQQKSLDLTIT